MQEITISLSKRLRDKVWQGLCLILGSLAGTLAIYNLAFNSQATVLAVIEILLVVYSAYIYLNVKKWSYITWQQYSYVALFNLIVAYAIWDRPLVNGIMVWPLFLPILCYLALGLRIGALLSTATFVVMFSIIASKLQLEDTLKSSSLLLNFTFCYICVVGISHVYERNRHRIEEDLVTLALTDALTGVRNRLAFKQDFAKLWSGRQEFGLLMLDIDHFKKVNDNYGHDVGDELLMQLTTRIKGVSDSLNVYRHGGEEFCLLVVGEHKYVALQAEMIRQAVAEESFRIGDLELNITVSIGVSMISEIQEASELIVLADTRMYRAKHQGRNCAISEG